MEYNEECRICKSKNTYIKYGKQGHYVSYYDIICKDCGHIENRRG